VTGYEYVRAMRGLYSPRTPRAAFVAAEAGILPVEALVYKACSVKPLFEEPYDLDELERVLAQRDLSFADAMMLAEIFAAMTRDVDKERALFAAESLTALENRWARKVESLRRDGGPDERGGPGDGKAEFDLARALYEQAIIAGRSAPIRNYYLLEAYYILCQRPEAGSGGPAFGLLIRCLVRLGLLDQAQSEVDGELGLRDDGELLALAVEIAYMRKDVRRVRELLAGRDLVELGFEHGLYSVLASWQG
jgi:hypothetical protein